MVPSLAPKHGGISILTRCKAVGLHEFYCHFGDYNLLVHQKTFNVTKVQTLVFKVSMQCANCAWQPTSAYPFHTVRERWNVHWIKNVQVLQNFFSLLFSTFFHCSTFLSILQYISNRKDVQKGDFNQKSYEIPRFQEKFWKNGRTFAARWLGNNFQVHNSVGDTTKAYVIKFLDP